MKYLFQLTLLSTVLFSCNSINTDMKTIPVDASHFIESNFLDEIKQETVDLNGTPTLCYIIKSNSQPSEHQMGPWCPTHLADSDTNGGIWFEDGKVYDVDGHFIAELAEFYSDDEWELFRRDSTIKVTKTKAECEGAAKPDVEEEFQNYCVECLPEYYKNQVTTYTIPVNPVFKNSSTRFRRGGIGLAFNGVNFDPPAPTHAILAAHTIAPLDDHGGHVNPHGGYHYHAATGSTKEIKQSDIHSPMIGYAIDGFGIYALLDETNHSPTDLDECGGHSDDTRGYHYHAGEPGSNEIIKCLHGEPGHVKVDE